MKALDKAKAEVTQLKADRAANRNGRLSAGQQRVMSQAMAFFEQIQATALSDVVEAVGDDRQAFAHFTHLAQADLVEAHAVLHEMAAGVDDADYTELDGQP
jgi:hypothetical protein